jgi:hypothetical protein
MHTALDEDNPNVHSEQQSTFGDPEVTTSPDFAHDNTTPRDRPKIRGIFGLSRVA